MLLKSPRVDTARSRCPKYVIRNLILFITWFYSFVSLIHSHANTPMGQDGHQQPLAYTPLYQLLSERECLFFNSSSKSPRDNFHQTDQDYTPVLDQPFFFFPQGDALDLGQDHARKSGDRGWVSIETTLTKNKQRGDFLKEN